jgi:FkbM family methyltransferase
MVTKLGSKFIRILRMSLNSSFSSKFPILTLSFRGRYLHLWPFGAIIDVRALSKPRAEGQANFPLFTWRYRPQLGDTVLDLGCGIGTELAAFSKAVGRNGKVVAVDASKDCCEIAQELVNLLNLKNVVVENLAIGGVDGWATFPESGTELNNRIVSPENGALVEQVTIKSLMSRHKIRTVNFLKMNIEGAEGVAVEELPFQDVQNMAVSCHDFTGDPSQETFSRVWNWAEKNNLRPQINPSHDPHSCEGRYIYTASSFLGKGVK